MELQPIQPQVALGVASYDESMVEDLSPSLSGDNGRNRVDQLRSVLTKLHLIGFARFLDRSARRVAFSSINLLRTFSRLPLIGRGFDPLLDRFDPYDRLHFELTEVLRVCRALDDGHLSYWVAGGWGLDALVGSETRHHGDLDVVLEYFREDLTTVTTLLTSLGYRRKRPLGGTVWFPDAEVYEDERGHHIEVLNINWPLLVSRGWLREATPTLETESNEVLELEEIPPLLVEQCTASGVLEGTRIPVLSVSAQQLFHVGYEKRREDSHAQEILRLISKEAITSSESESPAVPRPPKPESRQPSTLLLVPIFSFPPDLLRLCRLYHNDLNLIPPHVTVAFPFLPLKSVSPDVIEQLSSLFATVPALDFELSQVRWFDTHVVYLEPSNSVAFRSITETLQRTFPQFHPYDGAFDSVIPHVTLSEHGSLAERRVLARQAPKYLPITARASHVWLMSNEQRPVRWSIKRIFELGITPLAPLNDHQQ
jgi:2'-5' RNA ligase